MSKRVEEAKEFADTAWEALLNVASHLEPDIYGYKGRNAIQVSIEHIRYLIDELDKHRRYKLRLESHMKGEGCKHFCQNCTKPIWFVDDEPMICPYCKTEGFHVPDIGAEKIA